MPVKPISVFASCARVSNATSASKSTGIIAYPTQNNVALYDPSDKEYHGPTMVLRGHSKRVNCVRWLSRPGSLNQNSDDIGMVSGSVDKTARFWQKQADSDLYETGQILDGHGESVTVCACLGSNLTAGFPLDLIVTGSSDGHLFVWARNSADKNVSFIIVQRVKCDGRFPLDVALEYLPGTKSIVMALSLTDKNIRVFVSSALSIKFDKVLILKGHSDWIKSLSFVLVRGKESDFGGHFRSNDLILASGSQDKYIRLWRFAKLTSSPSLSESFNLEELLLSEIDQQGGSSRSYSFRCEDVEYSVSLNSVLMGFEDWVHSCQWHPPVSSIDENGNNVLEQPLKILAASADKSLIVWSFKPDTGMWTTDLHVGDIGGTALGMYGAVWGHEGKFIIGQGYHGNLHVWTREVCDGEEDEYSKWKSDIGPTGHFKEVSDMQWDPTFSYLITTSHDQTTRIFSLWKRILDGKIMSTWHEVAQAQCHGFDIQTIAVTKSYEFVSGALGEKIIRVFEAPKTFVQTIEDISGSAPHHEGLQNFPSPAMLPALGLSNKIEEYNATSDEVMSKRHIFTRPPLPTDLHHFTLWPEKDKLYGHGDSVFALTSSHTANFLASSSIGRTGGRLEDTAIRIWRRSIETEAKNFLESQKPIQAHTLTVTDLEFSWSDRYLVSVGRDRSWALSKLDSDKNEFALVAVRQNAHSRIIWRVSWSWDEKFFMTASRDKTCSMWQYDDTTPVVSLSFEHAVTCVAMCPIPFKFASSSKQQGNETFYLAAFGLENGDMHIGVAPIDKPSQWKIIESVTNQIAHSDSITRLRWRVSINPEAALIPKELLSRVRKDNSLSAIEYQLASCSNDHSVRLWQYSN